jgi:hypothetical protein
MLRCAASVKPGQTKVSSSGQGSTRLTRAKIATWRIEFSGWTAQHAISWAHNLAHKNVLNVQLKQWMRCMQCEFFLGNLVLVDSKGLHEG